MTVTREELAAFADGELEAAEHARVSKALAADPDLRHQLEVHRQLKTVLAAHYDPILEQHVPETLIEAVRRTAPAPDETEMTEPETAEVVSFAEARAARDEQIEGLEAKRRLPRWSYIAGPALAASLVAVAVFSLRGGPESPATGDYADAQLASVLNDQLVAEQGQTANTRILLSFRDKGDRFCRAFSGESAGIACRDNSGWQLQRIGASGEAQSTDYRQAGASDANLLEAAQGMAKGAALDAEAEAAAKEAGWR
uniref:anti-sigma factor family protein n=1 Tax=Parerythrobacter lutipelagi TaxID=1964208 RepID=UPI0010F4A9BF|nr:transcriptional regulator [Parerythrobacter lutipelagi]